MENMLGNLWKHAVSGGLLLLILLGGWWLAGGPAAGTVSLAQEAYPPARLDGETSDPRAQTPTPWVDGPTVSLAQEAYPPPRSPIDYSYPGAQTPTPMVYAPVTVRAAPTFPTTPVIIPEFTVQVQVSGLKAADRATLTVTSLSGQPDARLVQDGTELPSLEVANGDYTLRLQNVPLFLVEWITVKIHAPESYFLDPDSYFFGIDDQGQFVDAYWADRALAFLLIPPELQKLPPCRVVAATVAPLDPIDLRPQACYLEGMADFSHGPAPLP